MQTLKKIRKRFKNQEQLALALHITQPSLSALMRGKFKPSVTLAKAIANLDSQTLEDLVGPYGESSAPSAKGSSPFAASSFPNLEICIRFHSGQKHWAAWTVAAARAGFFGDEDFPGPSWVPHLDGLEKALERARKELSR